MKKRVLIVDDEPLIREGLQKILELNHFEVVIAANGNEALQRIAQTHPQVVVTDIIMPEKDGVEVIMELRTRYPNTKIIAISGGGRINAENHLEIAEHLGVHATLTKPFATEKLIRKIEELITG